MSGSDNDNTEESIVERSAALSIALDHQGKKKQSANILKPYTRFACWWTRSENLFVNWYVVLEKGLAWMGQMFGKYSKKEFEAKFQSELHTYNAMATSIECFEDDLPYFENPKNSGRTDDLVKAMISASSAARSDDIASLCSCILVYIAEADPNYKSALQISARVKKSDSRGFKHPVLAQLLCPIKYHDDFDRNPTEFAEHLDNGSVKVRAQDMPSFLWPRDSYDPEDQDANMFRNPALVMVWKHIFTSPSSALKDGPGQTKTKGSQSKMNKMRSVSPGSIAYACVQFRHAISSIDDWRIDNKLFK